VACRSRRAKLAEWPKTNVSMKVSEAIQLAESERLCRTATIGAFECRLRKRFDSPNKNVKPSLLQKLKMTWTGFENFTNQSVLCSPKRSLLPNRDRSVNVFKGSCHSNLSVSGKVSKAPRMAELERLSIRKGETKSTELRRLRYC